MPDLISAISQHRLSERRAEVVSLVFAKIGARCELVPDCEFPIALTVHCAVRAVSGPCDRHTFRCLGAVKISECIRDTSRDKGHAERPDNQP